MKPELTPESKAVSNIPSGQAPQPTRLPRPLLILILLYLLLATGALWRAFASQSLDLFTLGILPVLAGLLLRTPWASLVLKIYLGLQTLGFAALGVVAFIAWRITPQDVKVEFMGQNIPMLPLILGIILLLAWQYAVAFAGSTNAYLNHGRTPAAQETLPEA